jgi:hypothetical protein
MEILQKSKILQFKTPKYFLTYAQKELNKSHINNVLFLFVNKKKILQE